MATMTPDMIFAKAKQTMVDATNYCLSEYGAKFYEMEIIFREIYAEIQNNAQKELEKNQAEYDNAIKAEQETSSEPIEEVTDVEVFPAE